MLSRLLPRIAESGDELALIPADWLRDCGEIGNSSLLDKVLARRNKSSSQLKWESDIASLQYGRDAFGDRYAERVTVTP
jgi:hypothetical protein